MASTGQRSSLKGILGAHHRDIARLQRIATDRQRAVIRDAFLEVQAGIDGMGIPASSMTWTQANQRVVMSMVGDAYGKVYKQGQGVFLDDVAGTTLASQGHTAGLLATLDKRYRGIVTPLRFDTLDWWGNTNEEIGAVRLRQYQQSFKRYGNHAITKVEDAIAKATIQRKTWREMRGEVWGAVSKTVDNQQWMVDRIVRTELSAAYNGTTLAALHEEDDPNDPMLKKLVATFDNRTGKDSEGVHNQTKKLNERFFDAKLGIFFQAPPNRPHDREAVMGWRTSYGDAMADPYDDKTRMSVQVPARPSDAMMAEPPALLTKAVDPSLPEMTLTQAAKVIGLKRVTLHHAHLKGVLKTAVKVPAGKGKAVPMVTAEALEAFRVYHLDLKFGAGKKAAKVAKAAKPKPAPGPVPKPKPGDTVKVGKQSFEVKAKVGPGVVDTDKGLIQLDGNAKLAAKADVFDAAPKKVSAWDVEAGDYLAGTTSSKWDNWSRLRRVEKVEALPSGKRRLYLEDGEWFDYVDGELVTVRKASVQAALEEKAAELVTDPYLVDLDLVELPDFKTHAKLKQWMKVEHGVDFNLASYDLELAKQIAQRVVSRSRRFSYMNAQTKIGTKKMKAGSAAANKEQRSIMFSSDGKDHETWGKMWDGDLAKPFGPKGAKVDTPFGAIKHFDRKNVAQIVADHEIGHHLQYGVWDAAKNGDALAVMIRDEWTKLVAKHAGKPSTLAKGLSRYASVGWEKSGVLGAELGAESTAAIWNGKGHLVHSEVRKLLQKAMRMNPTAKAAKLKKLDVVKPKAKVVPKPKPPAKPIEPKVPVAAKAEPADVLDLDLKSGQSYTLNEAKKSAQVPYGSIQGAVKSGKLKSTKIPKINKKTGEPMFGKKTGEPLYEYTVDGEDLKAYAKAYHAKKGKTVAWKGDAPELPKPKPKPVAPKPKPVSKPPAPKPSPKPTPTKPSAPEMKPAYSLNEIKKEFNVPYGTVQGAVKSGKLKHKKIPKLKADGTPKLGPKTGKPLFDYEVAAEDLKPWLTAYAKKNPKVKVPGGAAPKPKPEAPPTPTPKPKPEAPKPKVAPEYSAKNPPPSTAYPGDVHVTHHDWGGYSIEAKKNPKDALDLAPDGVVSDFTINFSDGTYASYYDATIKNGKFSALDAKVGGDWQGAGDFDLPTDFSGIDSIEVKVDEGWLPVPKAKVAPKPKPKAVPSTPKASEVEAPTLKLQQATYTVAEAKKATGIPYGSVVSGIKSGKLPAVEVAGKPVIKKADLEAFAKWKAEQKAKKAAKTSAVKPKAKAKVSSSPTSSELPTARSLIREKPIEASKWKNVGGQKGSNPGGTYEAENGDKWYVKTPQGKSKYAESTGKELARNEALAAKLYKAGGIEVAEVELAVREGKTSIASKIIDGLKQDRAALTGAKKPDGVYDGCAMDAWLANWDVVGQGYDNLLIKGGKVIRVDTGGALRFRAQGGPKGNAFGDVVGELESLRNGPNPQANSVFRDMTDDDLIASIDKVLAVNDDTVRELVEAYGPKDKAGRDVLAKRLIRRKEDLRKKRGELIESKKAAEKAKEQVAGFVKKLDAFYESRAKSGYMRDVMVKDLKKGAEYQAQVFAKMTPDQKKRFQAAVEREIKASNVGLNSHAFPKAGKTTKDNHKRDMAEWIDKRLQPRERAAIKAWSGSEYRKMRAVDSGRGLGTDYKLSAEDLIDMREKLASIREGFLSSKAYHGVVYRGINLYGKEAEKLLKSLTTVGEEIVQEAVSSWASSESVANGFASTGHGSVVLKIKTRRGVSMSDSRTTYYPSETEIMTDKGHRYRVLSVKKKGGRQFVELEELDD